MTQSANFQQPSTKSVLREFRVIFEMLTTVSLQSYAEKGLYGDGHPVVIAPSFMLGDGSSALLRKFLRRKGYAAYGWGQGRNTSLQESVYRSFEAHVKDIAARHGGKVTVIGWSLGGLYARCFAAHHPEFVRQVITLGSPMHIPRTDTAAVSGAVAKLYEWLNPGALTDPMLDWNVHWQARPSVPSTAIFSRGDGIVDWKCCVDLTLDGQTENLSVPGSHVGLTHNLAVFYVLLDRLAQKEREWKPFDFSGVRGKIFSNGDDHVPVAV